MAIIGFDTSGRPERRLERWDDIPAHEIESGSPVQRGRYALNAPEIGLTAGEWDCTAFTSTLMPYPVHEFMSVLEGVVEIVAEDGSKTRIAAGESFVIPKGLRCKWHQPGYMRKFFMIFDDGTGPVVDGRGLRVHKLDHRQQLAPSDGPPPDVLLTPAPSQAAHEVVNGAGGQWSVGIWQSTPYERKAVPFPRHELMHLLEGAVIIGEPDGTEHRFTAGDTFLITEGTTCSWKSTVPVKKIYCTLNPRAAAARPAAAE
jgi:uncharacterized cupin superfamily protein